MTQTDTTTVHRQIVVPATIDRAFAIFVERFDAIKPRDHNLMDSPIVQTVFEPQVGGHVYDRAADGSVCRWARVLAFDPPSRLRFSWDISPRWELESDLENTSEVEVRFTADGDDRTIVDLEHRNLDRHGPGWERMRDGVDAPNGWTLYLDRFADQID